MIKRQQLKSVQVQHSRYGTSMHLQVHPISGKPQQKSKCDIPVSLSNSSRSGSGLICSSSASGEWFDLRYDFGIFDLFLSKSFQFKYYFNKKRTWKCFCTYGSPFEDELGRSIFLFLLICYFSPIFPYFLPYSF